MDRSNQATSNQKGLNILSISSHPGLNIVSKVDHQNLCIHSTSLHPLIQVSISAQYRLNIAPNGLNLPGNIESLRMYQPLCIHSTSLQPPTCFEKEQRRRSTKYQYSVSVLSVFGQDGQNLCIYSASLHQLNLSTSAQPLCIHSASTHQGLNIAPNGSK